MHIRLLLSAVALLTLGAQAQASTLNQNVSWTIDRPGTSTVYRVVAYGDSIYAGYNGSTVSAAKYSAPTIDAEYLSALWNADIESVRRTKSGAGAPRYTSFTAGKTPIWNQYGHERMGWLVSTYNAATP